MQDIHSIGGGRFFAGGGGGGGDRRLRQHQHQQAQPQALKCPRCDSANTKFCYYNNYNLSQPRHFCKSCRRYWTKGGVLRNVPVGGGCRKTKRSKQKSNSSSVSAAAPAPERDLKSSNSHSSSESSSLTATTTNATEAVSATPSSNPSFSDQPPTAAVAAQNSLLEGGSSECGSLFLEIGSFASLIATSSSSAAVSGGGVGVGVGTALPFEFGSIAPFRLNHHHHHNHHHLSQSWNQQKDLSASIGVVNRDHRDQELKVREIGSAGGLMVDQTAQVDLSVLQQDRSNGGGFGSLGDWQQCGDQGLFDLTNTVDQQYWSQNQWNDQDHPGLYLP